MADNERSQHLDKLISRAKSRDFFDDPLAGVGKAPVRDQTRAVRRDRMDQRAWDVILDQVPALQRQVEASAEKHPTADGAYEDLFNILNQGDPRLIEVDRMQPRYAPLHGVAGQMLKSEDIGYLRNETKYDEYNTALAMLTMKDRMEQSQQQIDDAVKAIDEAAQALADAIANGEAVMVQMGDAEGEPDEGLQAYADEAMQQLIEAMGAAAAADSASRDTEAEVKALMEKAMSEAKEAIDREAETMKGYGLDDGNLQRMSFAERRALAERLDSGRMERFAKLLGTFRMFADAERRRKVNAVPSEVYDVELGSDLARLQAGELTNLVIPEMEELFWLRHQREELLLNKVRGSERAGKGPILVVCDESGSMGSGLDAEGNTREMWSKAVTLALADQAFRSKRDFTYIGFSSPRQVWEIDFPKGEMTPENVIAFAEHFFGGGTAYEGPIQRAGQIVQEAAQKGRALPDIVFITDDSCRVSEPFIAWWNELRESIGITAYGLQIGGEPYANNLKDLTDRCMNIDSLNAHPQGVVELFRNI